MHENNLQHKVTAESNTSQHKCHVLNIYSPFISFTKELQDRKVQWIFSARFV